ncbi:hypothetical protein [Flagellimonas onchidii]|uniref:hypothetical protein n=1 Tax=Flagellimonas onchidii TaxID=2562684 RepID=UPI0010A68FA5|nr:hypothetical protein [Allomuricauda onchidii]
MSNILGEIIAFLDQSTHKTMELHFSTQKIMSFRNGVPHRQILRPDRRLVVKKLASPVLGKITVVDNLLFKFSFRFIIPCSSLLYQGEMMQLQFPVSFGYLMIDPDAQVIRLVFEIDAPDDAIALTILHIPVKVNQ